MRGGKAGRQWAGHGPLGVPAQALAPRGSRRLTGGGRAPTRDASGAITRDPGGPARNPPGQDRSSPSKIVVAGPSNTESALNVIRCLAGVGEEDTLYGF